MYSYLTLRLGIEVLVSIMLCFTFFSACLVTLKFWRIRQQMRKEVILLELTPPPSPHNTLLATEEFFTVLGHVVSLRSWRDLVSGRRATIALEVVSSRTGGIRYLARMPRYDLPIFLQNLQAFAPTVMAEEAEDYMPKEKNEYVTRLLDIRQTGAKHYALRHTHVDTSSDPIAYVTSAIAQLEEDELIALQLVLSPTSERHVSQNTQDAAIPEGIVSNSLHKASQLQFQTSIRFLVQTTSDERANQRVKSIRSALTAYSYEGYQSLQPRLDIPGWLRSYRLYTFHNRLPTMFKRTACLLAGSELASLYHFPYGTAVHTEDLRMKYQTALPIPLAVKNQQSIDLIIGENMYRGRTTPIGVSEDERQRHMYVVGGTGNGKSTLLKQAFVQDMRSGKGLALIDPHGDLAEDLLKYVPEDRIDDVVYFNPSDIRHPIGLNLLELSPNLDADSLLLEKDMVTETIISMFRKIFSTNDTSGHRIEYVLRNAVQTALALHGSTLFTIYDLLNDVAFRKRAIAQLDNPDLLLFWREFNRAGSYQQVSMSAGITAKIGRFLFSASAKRILEQTTSSINFDELMQSGKILICNVSKGQLGEDTSELFGIMVLAKLQIATLRRATLDPDKRIPFYVYVDEFQNFATPSFVQLLSEARKYGLFLVMAEQSTSQQSDRRLIDIVFANVGITISFRTSSPLDEQLLQPLLAPHVEPNTLSRLPAYHFYVRISATETQIPFSGQTVLLDTPGDEMLAKLVIQASRMRYGKRVVEPAALSKQPAVLAPKNTTKKKASSKPTVPGST